MIQSEQLIELWPHKNYLEQTKQFVSQYELIDVIVSFDPYYQKLKPKAQRKCRFCGKKQGDTTFSDKAHLIPEMLGNKELFSDFECDACNKFFGREFENDLSNYLGISRSFSGTKGKKGVPGFTSPGDAIKVRQKELLGDKATIITREDITNNAVRVDTEKGSVHLQFKKNPFRPIRVYKAILKIALSLLPGDEIESNYKLAIDFLMEKEPSLISGCLMSGYSLPLTFNFPPHAFVFKKRDLQAQVHTHIVVLNFQNSIFSIPVPLHQSDLIFFKANKSIPVPLYPPLFTLVNAKLDFPISPFCEDFSSENYIKGLIDELTIQFNPEDLKNSAQYNPDTKQLISTPFDPAEIVQFIVRPVSDSVDPETLHQELKKYREK